MIHINPRVAGSRQNVPEVQAFQLPPKVRPMFPEFRDQIALPKTQDARFARLFSRHNELDQERATDTPFLLRRSIYNCSP